MAKAYTPGLKVSPRMHYRARRLLPIPGEVLFQQGDHVEAEEIVAQTFMPGDVMPVNLSNQLSQPPKEVINCMLRKEGDKIEQGEVIARTKGIFGFLKTEYKSKVSGTIESISNVTGQMIVRGAPLPVQVQAYISGTVVEVLPTSGVIIEAEVTYIQGIFGIGGETFGTIRTVCATPTQELSADLIKPEHKGAIIIGGARMTGEAVKKAISVGALAVVSGGMDDQDLRNILGYDLGVAVTGSEQIGCSLVITEGFGEIAMAKRTFELLKSREGQFASLNGATQIRAGVMRPEIVIPLNQQERAKEPEVHQVSGYLEVGTPVRIIRDPWFGLLGEVSGLPQELTVLESGSKARILNVKLPSGDVLSVPRANVEIIGD